MSVCKILRSCKLLCFSFIISSSIVNAQQINPKDVELFEKAWQNKEVFETQKTAETTKGEETIAVAKSFLGIPYVASTLEGDKEELRICLKGQDCVTFVEYALALAITDPQAETPLEAFSESLEKIRYRNGELKGYTSRLHYFTEWLSDNAQKGIIKNKTQDCGGIFIEEKLDFISTHRMSYKALSNDAVYDSILKIENKLAQTQFSKDPKHFHYYIPKEEIKNVESCIKDGDIIALCTSIGGLDISHVGLAIHKNGRLHFLHASLTNNAIEITEKPLYEYLKGIKHNTGIKVAEIIR